MRMIAHFSSLRESLLEFEFADPAIANASQIDKFPFLHCIVPFRALLSYPI